MVAAHQAEAVKLYTYSVVTEIVAKEVRTPDDWPEALDEVTMAAVEAYKTVDPAVWVERGCPRINLPDGFFIPLAYVPQA